MSTSTTNPPPESRFILDLTSSDGHLVHSEGSLWLYDERSRIYLKVTPPEIARRVYELDGMQTNTGVIKASRAFARGVHGAMGDLVDEPRFFIDAPRGAIVNQHFLYIANDQVEMIDADVGHRQRHRLSIPYDSTANTDLWDRFLKTTLNDDEVESLVNEVIGCAVMGLGDFYQKVFVFHGIGSNGKSTVMSVIRSLLPSAWVTSVSPTAWTREYLIASLGYARVNLGGELPELSEHTMPMLKKLSGGDMVMARPVGGNAYMIQCRAIHIFAANDYRALPETSYAIERRWVVVEFPNVLPPSKRIPNYAEELVRQGGPGILRRAIEGADALVKRGHFIEPGAVVRATMRWLHMSNPTMVFVKSCLEQTGERDDRVAASEMARSCEEFCKTEGLRVPGVKEIKSVMEHQGFHQIKAGSNYWVGVRLRA